MVYWSYGVMVYWSYGVIVYWSYGVMALGKVEGYYWGKIWESICESKYSGSIFEGKAVVFIFESQAFFCGFI